MILTPKTKTQNSIAYTLSLTISFLIFMLGAYIAEASKDGPTNYEALSVIGATWLVSQLPTLAAALKLPALGTEPNTYLTKRLGSKRTNRLLKQAVKPKPKRPKDVHNKTSKPKARTHDRTHSTT